MLSIPKRVSFITFLSLFLIVFIGVLIGTKKKRTASFEELCENCKLVSENKKSDEWQALNISLPTKVGKIKLNSISNALKEKYCQPEYEKFIINYQLGNQKSPWAVYEYASELSVIFSEEDEQSTIPELL